MTNSLRRGYALVLSVAGVVLFTPDGLAQYAIAPRPSGELVLDVDPAQSKVSWTLAATFHSVHGSFVLKKGTLHLDPESGAIGGEIVVDATSGKSGDDSRDKKMHKDVLESARFTEVVFRPDRVVGKIAPLGKSGVRLHGFMAVHGGEHELTVPVQAEFAGDRWTGSAKFSVPFIEWGLKNPSTFLLKVSHQVDIELELSGRLQRLTAP